MLEDVAYLRTIGQKVEEVGKNRDRIVSELKEAFARPLNEDDLETVDAFLAGL
jgi:hypothetical protein